MRVLGRCAAVAAGMAGLAVTTGCAEQATRDGDTNEVTEAGQEDVFDLGVGDCFDDEDASQVSDVQAVPCSEAHDNEIFSTVEMPAGDWPGDDAVQAAAEEHCTPAFEEFVGVSYDESELYWFPLTPTEGGWENIDDREIACAVYADEPVEGTLADAGY